MPFPCASDRATIKFQFGIGEDRTFASRLTIVLTVSCVRRSIDPAQVLLVARAANPSPRVKTAGARSQLPVRFPGILGDFDKVLVAEVVDWPIPVKPSTR